MTLGEKLQKLRKQSGLSQEALAEKVAVTRQTISKWELDQSTPELAVLAQLSELFQVSTDYLIKDKVTEPQQVSVKKKFQKLTIEVRQRILAFLTAVALLAGAVCLICDYFTASDLTWSRIVILSIAAGWLMLLPLLTAKERIIKKTLWGASLVPIPFLALLALFLQNVMILKLGSCIALAAIVMLWVIYVIFKRNDGHYWRAAGFSLLVVLVFTGVILCAINAFLQLDGAVMESSAFNGGITLLLSLACFGMDHLHSQKHTGDKN